jgi:signal peptidase I
VAPFALIALAGFGMGHFPITSYGRVIFALVAVLGLCAALYIVSMVLTWRESRLRRSTSRWSRWYGLAVIVLAAWGLSQLTPRLMHSFYKPFYAPSESMAPTIGKGDKFIADMRWRGPFQRGDLVIFNGPDNARVSRIAAIEGDKIAMRGGVPIVNGVAAVQYPHGQTTFVGSDGLQTATLLIERLPGETSIHRVLDTGVSEFDNTQEVTVPANHFFVLGDNRDNSADSRVPPEIGGAGMVPFAAVIGRPLYIHWSSDRSKIGTRLDK